MGVDAASGEAPDVVACHVSDEEDSSSGIEDGRGDCGHEDQSAPDLRA